MSRSILQCVPKKSTALSPRGFTLIELLLAMTLFVTIILLFTAGFIGINRTFTRGMIRKQLSESVQTVTENISHAIRTSEMRSLPFECTTGTDTENCPAAPNGSPERWQILCFTNGSRYFWSPAAGGLYRDHCVADTPLVLNNATQLVDSRYRVDALELALVSSGEGSQGVATALYRIRGVMRTKTDDAFVFNNVENPEQQPDPFQTRCKGTAQSSAVQTCAIENFSFIVNARGGDI